VKGAHSDRPGAAVAGAASPRPSSLIPHPSSLLIPHPSSLIPPALHPYGDATMRSRRSPHAPLRAAGRLRSSHPVLCAARVVASWSAVHVLLKAAFRRSLPGCPRQRCSRDRGWFASLEKRPYRCRIGVPYIALHSTSTPRAAAILVWGNP